MGGGLEADLTQGAVPALWGGAAAQPAAAARWRPVLQVVDVRQYPEPDGLVLRPSPAQYRLLLSDGVYAQHAMLATALNPLAKGEDLRRGSVVRLLRFHYVPDPDHVRTLTITKLEILQTECALIRSLKRYKPPRNSRLLSTRSMSH